MVEKAIAGGTAVLLVTTMVLPRRQTPAIIEKFFNGISKWSKVAIGQG